MVACVKKFCLRSVATLNREYHRRRGALSTPIAARYQLVTNRASEHAPLPDVPKCVAAAHAACHTNKVEEHFAGVHSGKDRPQGDGRIGNRSHRVVREVAELIRG